MTFKVIAVEMIEPKGFGRIRLQRIPDDSTSSVVPFVQNIRLEAHFRNGVPIAYSE